MRNRKISAPLAGVVAAATLLPLSAWAAAAIVPEEYPPAMTHSAAALGPGVPPLSAQASPAEPQLLHRAEATAERLAAEQAAAEQAAAEQAAAEQAAAEQAAAERLAAERAARERASRERASRDAARPRPVPGAEPAGGVWAALRQCESGGRYDINTGNGYYGAYQFLPSTWRSLGFPGMPHEAPPEMQDQAAQKLQARSGWGQWPACARRLGLR